jgi:hypothetical protein
MSGKIGARQSDADGHGLSPNETVYNKVIKIAT